MKHLLALLALFAICMNGCNQGPPVKKYEDGSDQIKKSESGGGEEEKIRAAVKAAGVKNKVAAIIDNGNNTWTCTIEPDGVGPNGEPPPGRPIPEQVLVEKGTFKVTRGMGGRGRKEQ